MERPEWFACATDDECVVVPRSACCGCSDVGVNRAFADEARAGLRVPATCSMLGCNSQPCPVATCASGMCSAMPGP